MNAIDKLIEAVAPKHALSRARARAALSVVRQYEGAAQGRRTDGWHTRGTGPNAENRPALRVLRNRSRDLVRNNPYAARGISIWASNIVGYGIRTTVSTPNKKQQKAVQAAYKNWAESTQCDFDGQHDMYGLQEIAARSTVESGEAIIRRRWRPASAGLTVPLQIQVLEAEFIDMSRDGTPVPGGGMIWQGVEFDAQGRRAAYFLFPQHPGEHLIYLKGGLISERVPAEDVIHIYRMDRPGQVRGVPWLAPVILRLRDFDEYEDAQLVRQKIAACFAAFVTDVDTPESTGATKANDLIDRLEPGIIEMLPPGKDVKFSTPPAMQGYSEYASVTLHAVAAGLGIPYESLTGDYSQVNFTSGKMGRSEFHGLLDVAQWKTFIPKFCGGTFGWFVEACALAGIPAQGSTAKYTPPRRALVDNTREWPAIVKAIRGGLLTQFEGVREAGYDPYELFDEYAEGNALLDEKKIILDSDPRKVTNGGQAQMESAANDDAGGNKSPSKSDA